MIEQEDLHSKMQKKQAEIEQLQAQLQETQAELELSQNIIAWMRTSNFWKLRARWVKIKQLFSNQPEPFADFFNPSSSHTPNTSSSPNSLANLRLPKISFPRLIPQQPTVLLVSETSIPQCFRYRVQQKIEQLQQLNYRVYSVPWTDYATVRHQLHFCHIVILFRVPAFPDVIRLINYAKALKKIVFFDIDDLVFDLNSYSQIIDSLSGRLPEQEIAGLIEGTKLFSEAMSLCDYAIASTPSLAKKMEEIVGSGNGFVHRNGIDALINNYLKFKLPKLPRDYISIFYGSGSRAHDADFELLAPSLVKILAKHENVRLTIIGYLNLPDLLLPYTDRIDRVNYLEIEPYFEFLSQADINIAPLQAGLFADCKSEIKWLEAALLGVPSVVPATQTYVEVLEDGVDALIAATGQDWFERLDALVSNPDLRHTVAENAYNKAQSKYSCSPLANNLKHILTSAIERSSEQGMVVLEEKNKKKKLLFVNVLYPPQFLGGATVVMKNIVDTLKAKRSDDYELYVFTCDVKNSNPYELSEYTQDGVHVTALSVAPGPELGWRYQDAMVDGIFKQYLAFHSPDLIHFHCIQHLTASTLAAAEELEIPFIVTVHDAWWLGDHQFLIDSKGVECDPHLNDPVIAARHTDDINRSILRRRYLAKHLNQAKALLAVSEFQARQYRENGFTQVRVNHNGIMPRPVLPRKPAAPNRVRLGFAGGLCVPKGYHLLKEAITIADLYNTDLTVIVVDLFAKSKAVQQEKWGSTPVTFIPMLPAEKMPEFFSSIDVLVAPSVWTESFGLITREATMARVWVVASNKGGLAEDIRPGINGDVFSPNDIDELVAILKRIDREPERYHQLLSEATHIRTVDQQVSELESLYETILNEQNVRA